MFKSISVVIITYIAMMIFIVWANQATADTSVFAGGLGYHIPNKVKYNNWHRLMAIEHDNFVGAFFKNSYRQDTLLIGVNWKIKETRKWNVGLITGAMRGYRQCPVFGFRNNGEKMICPATIPYASYKTDRMVEPMIIVAGNSLSLSVRIVFGN